MLWRSCRFLTTSASSSTTAAIIMHATRAAANRIKHESSGEQQAKPLTSAEPDAKPVSGWIPPDNWRQLLDNIRLMRMSGNAPVDLVGCEKCVDRDTSPKSQRYEVLVSLMLSSQTKDEVTHAACERLRAAGLSPRMILDIGSDELGELIKPVGFWRKKVVYLKKVAEILLRDYDGDIPGSVEELCKLPGVGPKMSHLAMSVAWNKVTGIAVDTHVHRICNRLKFVKGVTKDPKKTEQQIEDWLPRELWPDFNSQLVGFGQTICTPRNPKCGQCLNQSICPSSENRKASRSRNI